MWLPDNLMSHRGAWIRALKSLINQANNDCDRSYWQHELNAMQKMYAEIDRKLLSEDEAMCHPGFPTCGFKVQ